MTRQVDDLSVEMVQAASVKTCNGTVGGTMNRISHTIDKSEIDWVDVRHEEASAFAEAVEALVTDRLTARAKSRGPASAVLQGKDNEDAWDMVAENLA
jgi:pyruvate dehydrogenase (quinone)